MQRKSDDDPRNLICEAYRIAGISSGACRSIFLDWALSLPQGADSQAAMKRLLSEHGQSFPDHPMNAVLRQGLAASPKPRRKGGASARRTRNDNHSNQTH